MITTRRASVVLIAIILRTLDEDGLAKARENVLQV